MSSSSSSNLRKRVTQTESSGADVAADNEKEHHMKDKASGDGNVSFCSTLYQSSPTYYLKLGDMLIFVCFNES